MDARMNSVKPARRRTRCSWSARRSLGLVLVLLATATSGCSVRRYAVNKVGDILASGGSVFESDDDIELIGDALPFGLKLFESLVAESPRHRGLLLATCRGFVLYSYGYVEAESERLMEVDLEAARDQRARARRLYLRAHQYCLRGMSVSYPDFASHLAAEPEVAATLVSAKKTDRDVPLLYWSAVSLALAISTSRDDAAMLARLPESEALVERALELDESWNEGALHSARMLQIAAHLGDLDVEAIDRHYRRALELSAGGDAGLFVSYAETVSVSRQDRSQFTTLLTRAIAIDPDRDPDRRLQTLFAQRRARWLLERVDDLILDLGEESRSRGAAL